MATITEPPEIFPGLTLHHIEWETYCRLRDDPAHDRLRMIYLDGDLTIMSPQSRHDGNSRWIYEVVTAVAGAWEVDYMPIGTTTLRRAGRARMKGAGKEADEGSTSAPMRRRSGTMSTSTWP